MRILFSITYYQPYVSGLTIAAARWAEGLVRAGDRVTVLTMSGKAVAPARGRVGVAVAKHFARISKGFLSWDWVRKSFRLVGEHDVVVVHLPQFEGIVPAVAARLGGKPVVSVYHCEVQLAPGFINGIIQSLLEVSNAITLMLSDAVITYTQDYAKSSKLLRMIGTYRKEIGIIPIVPPIPVPRSDPRVTRTLRHTIGKPGVVLGVAARLAAEKGIEYLLEAVPLLEKGIAKPFKIVIAGPMAPVGEQAYRRRIRALVERYAAHTVFTGEIDPGVMGSFYSLIDLLVLPSVNGTEAFGMVQVEAMRMGKPVVAANLPGVRVPVKKTGMGVIVEPGNAASLARGILDVLKRYDAYTKPDSTIAAVFPEEQSVLQLRATLLAQ